jgi:four helix bundle protein
MSDFISKMSIALKEAKESGYWLKLIDESSLLEKDLTGLIDLNLEIIRLLTSIIRTSQQNQIRQAPRTKNH